MNLQFYNTLTRSIEPFQPREPGVVRMYSCGPTVYDYAHIGNFRAYVFSDLIHRVLRLAGYDVRLVMNITDVDDKTIRGSRAANRSLDEYTAPYITAFFEDIRTLNILPAMAYPRATHCIPTMIKLVEILREKGHTYESGGSTYFRIASFPQYGRLSNIDENVKAGAGRHRIDCDEYEKDNVADFVLWKAWSEDDGEVFWDSPLGRGRPGWHLECSAMSYQHLGPSLDIHTGGQDNRFPHHENEIAQSECAFGGTYVRYWLHCAHLLVNGAKMSKSLGNFYTLRDILAKGHSPQAVRLLLLSSHYRGHLNFTFEGLEAAKKNLQKIAGFIADVEALANRNNGVEVPSLTRSIEEARESFKACLADDLNTSGALGAIFELLHEFYRLGAAASPEQARAILSFLKYANEVFAVFSFNTQDDIPPVARVLLERRAQARAEKNWSLADELRQTLLHEYGLIVKDTRDGQKVSRA